MGGNGIKIYYITQALGHRLESFDVRSKDVVRNLYFSFGVVYINGFKRLRYWK